MSARITIDRLEQRDVHRCAALEKRLFADESPWPAAGFAEGLRAPYMRFYAAREQAEAGSRLIGYAAVALLGGSATGSYAAGAGHVGPENEVHTMAVEPEAQGRGVGRLLLDALLAEADAHGGPVFLDVRVGNEPAIGLYESAGFSRIGVRPRYYQPAGADALVMRRPPAGASEGGPQ